jgi:hypothetical protein
MPAGLFMYWGDRTAQDREKSAAHTSALLKWRKERQTGVTEISEVVLLTHWNCGSERIRMK